MEEDERAAEDEILKLMWMEGEGEGESQRKRMRQKEEWKRKTLEDVVEEKEHERE